MALNLSIIPSIHQKPILFLAPKHKNLCNFCNFLCSSSSSHVVLSATAEGKGGGDVTEEGPLSYSAFDLPDGSSSARTQLDLLDQLTSRSSSVTRNERDGSSSNGLTIRDQLAMLVPDNRVDDFSIQLGKKNLKKYSPKFLTTSQKRNIRRQSYLNEVSKRNDSVFFATIGAFVILPPLIILGISIATGYVQLFP